MPKADKTTYQQVLKKLKKAEKDLLDAEKKLDAQKVELSALREEVPQLHEELTDRMAEQQTGGGTKKAVNEARSRWEKGKDEILDLKTEIAATEKSIAIFQKKLEQAQSEFKGPALDHFRKKSAPLIKQMIDSIQDIKKTNGEMADVRQDMKDVGISYATILPRSFDLKFNMRGSRRTNTLEGFKQQLEKLKN